jgi:hypothetical protein
MCGLYGLKRSATDGSITVCVVVSAEYAYRPPAAVTARTIIVLASVMSASVYSRVGINYMDTVLGANPGSTIPFELGAGVNTT